MEMRQKQPKNLVYDFYGCEYPWDSWNSLLDFVAEEKKIKEIGAIQKL